MSNNHKIKKSILKYLQKKEVQKWKNAAKLASTDKEYLALCKDLGCAGTDIFEY